MTDPNQTANPAEPQREAKPRKPKNPKAITYEQAFKMTTALDLIDQLAGHHLEDLQLTLTREHKLKMRKGKDLRLSAEMHGIAGAPAVTARIALQNWAGAARRALLKAEG